MAAAAVLEGINLEQWRSTESLSGYKGVKIDTTYCDTHSPYVAHMTADGKCQYLGRFQTPEEAALAHAKEYIRHAATGPNVSANLMSLWL